jgi:hypothetical protein
MSRRSPVISVARLLQKLVCVAQHALPLTALQAVCLRTAKYVRPRLVADVAGHVLQIDGIGEGLTNRRQGRSGTKEGHGFLTAR